MSTRTVVVAHRQAMVAEGVRAALADYPGVAPAGAVTSARAAETVAAHVDAVALDEQLDGAVDVAKRLRSNGVRVVWIGEPGDEDDELRVPLEAPVAALADALVPGCDVPVRATLSEKQRRVLALVAQGMTAKQVARTLDISPKTVEQHKARIFEKLGVPNQAAAVRVFLSHAQGVPV